MKDLKPTFDPAVCCDHIKHSGPGWTDCVRCGSTCVRDRDGTIVAYSRGTRDQPKNTDAIKRAA